jgi:GDP-L-fucose synthase
MSRELILICGATGFIGRNILEYYGSKKGKKIRAVYNKRPSFDVSHLPADIEWIKADLRSADEVEKAMNGVSVVIQAAATTSGAKDIVTKPYIHVTDNAVMNSLLLRSAYHNNINHFVFFSCTVMYQSSINALKESNFDPSVPLHPRYFGVGNTKIYTEKMLEFFSSISEMKTTAIRHSNIYGPHDKFDFERSHVFGATISKVMLAKDEVSVWGTGEEERDLLHVDDLCAFVEKSILNQKEKYRLYNCGLGKKVSIRSLVELIIQKSMKDLTIKHDLTQPTIKTSLYLDCNLAREELGWLPQISLDKGVESTIAWWRQNIDPETLKLKG